MSSDGRSSEKCRVASTCVRYQYIPLYEAYPSALISCSLPNIPIFEVVGMSLELVSDIARVSALSLLWQAVEDNLCSGSEAFDAAASSLC